MSLSFAYITQVISGPTPGLTRDSISVEWQYEGRSFELVDTAGLTKIHVNPMMAKKSEKEKILFKEHKQVDIAGRFIYIYIRSLTLLHCISLFYFNINSDRPARWRPSASRDPL
jgi:hypothetical protein